MTLRLILSRAVKINGKESLNFHKIFFLNTLSLGSAGLYIEILSVT